MAVWNFSKKNSPSPLHPDYDDLVVVMEQDLCKVVDQRDEMQQPHPRRSDFEVQYVHNGSAIVISAPTGNKGAFALQLLQIFPTQNDCSTSRIGDVDANPVASKPKANTL